MSNWVIIGLHRQTPIIHKRNDIHENLLTKHTHDTRNTIVCQLLLRIPLLMTKLLRVPDISIGEYIDSTE